MSRRDTIIIAVLINACLLVVLFAASLNKKPEDHYACSRQQLPLSAPTPTIQFEDVERSLVQESKKLEESFPLTRTASRSESPLTAKETKSAETPPQGLPQKTKETIKPEQTQKFIEIRVKSGDYLERISRENNATVAEIMKCNDLKSTQLKIGQTLKIPASKQSNKPEAAPVRQYVVKVGDTAWRIANDHNMKLEDLLKLNHLDKETSKQLKPGDMLYIH